MSLIIAPSILASDFCNLEREIRSIEDAGADWVHVDVMDGHFVPPVTIGAPVVARLARVTRLPLDVHLMITNAEESVDSYIDAGASIVTVHVEAVRHLDRVLSHIRSKGVLAGVSLNPATPLSTLEWVLELADLFLIMSVNPGYGGQAFIPSALQKIRQLRNMLNERGVVRHIEVDGGVTPTNAGALVEAGANALVAGTAVFASSDRTAAIQALRTGP